VFKKEKPQPQPFYLSNFNAELAALINRAIAARIHLVDIDHCMEDRLADVRFRHAQRPVI
jgi:hypothetical protein